MTREQIPQDNHCFTTNSREYIFTTRGQCNCPNRRPSNLDPAIRCTLSGNEGRICLCSRAVFGEFLRTSGHLIRRFVPSL